MLCQYVEGNQDLMSWYMQNLKLANCCISITGQLCGVATQLPQPLGL